MKSQCIVGLLMMGCCAWAGVVHADSGVTGNINVSLGQKMLNSDWKSDGLDLRDQFELGLLFDIRPKNWPINLALDLLGSSKKDNGVTGSTSEFALGVRKYFMEQTNVQPFVGGGFANISAKEKNDDTNISVDDSALGFWLMGGVLFRPAPHVNLGLNVRYSAAQVEFNHQDVEAGGIHYGLFAGYHF